MRISRGQGGVFKTPNHDSHVNLLCERLSVSPLFSLIFFLNPFQSSGYRKHFRDLGNSFRGIKNSSRGMKNRITGYQKRRFGVTETDRRGIENTVLE